MLLRRFLHKQPTLRASNGRLFPTVTSNLCLLFADPLAAHLFAEIRWPALLPNIDYANGFDYGIDVVELEVPEDHIHMVVRSEPKMSPIRVMHVVKSVSAREFFRRYPEIKNRYFWGGKLWTQSYFVETIGNANEETIRKYVQNQLVDLDKHEAKYRQLGLL